MEIVRKHANQMSGQIDCMGLKKEIGLHRDSGLLPKSVRIWTKICKESKEFVNNT